MGIEAIFFMKILFHGIITLCISRSFSQHLKRKNDSMSNKRTIVGMHTYHDTRTDLTKP